MKRSVLVALILSLAVGTSVVYSGRAEAQKPASAAKYEEIEVVNGGTVVGQVKWAGSVPEVEQLTINKNVEVCAVGDQTTKPSPRLMVSPKTKGIKNTVVYLADIKKGKKLEMPETNPKLDQTGCVYEPHIIVAPVKSRLDMVSGDDVLHNIHMYGAASYNLAFPLKGKTITKRLRKPGVIRTVCDAGHSWMSAYIHVMKHPYYTLTDENGNFKIADVPPGTYKLQAWHEGWEIVKTEEKGGQISGYVFSDSIILEKEVVVPEKGEVEVTFELSGE